MRCSDECCLHFLSLPLEDPFLDQYPERVTASAAVPPSSAAVSGESPPLPPPLAAPSSSGSFPVPFADAGNPILAQIAFLASTVSPAVAAAAAQAALHFYTGEGGGRPPPHSADTSSSPMEEDDPLHLSAAREEQVHLHPPSCHTVSQPSPTAPSHPSSSLSRTV